MKFRVIYFEISLFFVLLLSLTLSISEGKTPTHIVKTGDTLWSICEKYYGDPYLWPELWEMNQFITNPHWINPGEIIKLLEYKEIELPAVKKEVEQKEQPVTTQKLMGVDISGFTDVNAIGLLLHERIMPWGKILDFHNEKILHTAGEPAYVKMYKENIKPGDKFTICNISDSINHPLTGKQFGYLYSFKGILEIEKAQKGYYIAKISESYKTIQKNDILIPYHPTLSCMLPVPYHGDITPHIVASKDKLEVLGQYSVVYIDAGSKKNIQEGNIFEAIQERVSLSEPTTKEMVTLPPIILGKIIILKTTEDTSAGVVFWVSKDFKNGVKVRPMSWRTQPKQFPHLASCPLE